MTEALDLAVKWLQEFSEADLDEIAADGGVTVGMVYQQEARTVQVPRLTALRSLPQEAPTDFVLVPREPTRDWARRAFNYRHGFPDGQEFSATHAKAWITNIHSMLAAAPTQPPASNPYEELVEAARAYREINRRGSGIAWAQRRSDALLKLASAAECLPEGSERT